MHGRHTSSIKNQWATVARELIMIQVMPYKKSLLKATQYNNLPRYSKVTTSRSRGTGTVVQHAKFSTIDGTKFNYYRTNY
jgi:hypothetical protein